MSDTLAIHQTTCPCCFGQSVLKVFAPGDPLTHIGEVACAYCCATGFIQTEVDPNDGRHEPTPRANPPISKGGRPARTPFIERHTTKKKPRKARHNKSKIRRRTRTKISKSKTSRKPWWLAR